MANPAFAISTAPIKSPSNIKVDTTTALQDKKNIVRKLETLTSPKGAKIQNPQVRKLLTKAIKAYKKGDHKSAVLRGLDATRIDEHCGTACMIVALGLEGLGELSKALAMYERAHQLDPTDPDLYMNLSLVAWKLGQIEIAEKFVRIFINMQPTNPSGYNNLGGILRDLGRYDEAIDTLRNAIYQFPQEPELWNTLGTVAMEDGNINDARTFYEEAIRLRPKYARALHNIAYAVHHTGPLDEALRYYNLALKYSKDAKDIRETEHSRSLCQLAMGNLTEGWDNWNIRLHPQFRGSIIYATDVPQWEGEDLAGKTLLVVGEQGLGDELMFSNTYQDLLDAVGPDGRLMVACDGRLIPLFQRSLPGVDLLNYVDRSHNGKTVRTVPNATGPNTPDFFAPCGTTLRYFRRDISLFPTDRAHLRADPDRISYWKDKLATLGDGPFVGICWRSLIMTAKRSKYFSPLELWAPVFKNRDVQFINLQYGDCKEDIAFVDEKFGTKIHDFDEIDLKNDLDDNAALCAALDLVLSAPTAAGALAGAVGTNVWLLTIGDVWPQLGTDRFPFFPNNHVIRPDAYADWPDLMDKVSGELSQFVQDPKTA